MKLLVVVFLTAISAMAQQIEPIQTLAMQVQLGNEIEREAGVNLLGVFITPYNPYATKGAYQVTVKTFSQTVSEIIVYNVTLENFGQKMAQVKRAVLIDFEERRKYLAQMVEKMKTLASQGPAERAMQPGSVGATVGVPLYFNVWTEIPLAVDGWSDRETKQTWIRTTITTDGILKNQNTGADKGILVTRLSTTIWTMAVDLTKNMFARTIFFVRSGTVSSSIRFEPSQQVASRLDLDAVSADVVQVYGENEWTLKPYLLFSVTLGLRYLEQTYDNARFQWKQAGGLGVMIADRFFVAGKMDLGTDFKTNSYKNWGGQVGWMATKLLMFKTGVDYTKTMDDIAYDSMYLVPKGWSFNSGMLLRY